MRIAVFGQASFGREVTEGLKAAGHTIVVVYAPPEGKRPDPLAELAEERGWMLRRYPRFRISISGKAIQNFVMEYRGLDVDLNVLPYTTVILPEEIFDYPPLGSFCFHPSLLPKWRGGSSIVWQLFRKETEFGVTVFKLTDDVDAGPIVVQRGGVTIEPNETARSLYRDKLYPLGVEAMLEAVQLAAEGRVVLREQIEEDATWQPTLDAVETREYLKVVGR